MGAATRLRRLRWSTLPLWSRIPASPADRNRGVWSQVRCLILAPGLAFPHQSPLVRSFGIKHSGSNFGSGSPRSLKNNDLLITCLVFNSLDLVSSSKSLAQQAAIHFGCGLHASRQPMRRLRSHAGKKSKARHRSSTAHERARYRCFLPDLAGLAGKRRAEPMPDRS